MTVLKRFAVSVVLISGLLVAAPPLVSVATGEPAPRWVTVYEVWGKDAKVVATATPDNPDPGVWILLGSSTDRAGAQRLLATLTRHGGFVLLHIKERQVKVELGRPVAGKRNGNIRKPLDDGLVQPKRPIGEIQPKPQAPGPRPAPKGFYPLLDKG